MAHLNPAAGSPIPALLLSVLTFAPCAGTLAADMEPNTSCSSAAAGISPDTSDHGLPSELSHSLFSPPPSFSLPPPEIFSTSASGSSSPAVGDDGSFSVHGHATSQFLPSTSFFPDAGTFHMSAGDIFPQPQLEAFTGGESAVLEQIAALAPFFSPPSAYVPPPPRGSVGGAGSATPSSSDYYELPLLPETLCIPEASMTPWHCGGSSMDVAGASSYFAQSSLNNSMLTPSPASLQQPPVLPVKEEPVDEDTAARREPVFISLVDDGEDELDQDAILNSIAGAEGHSTPSHNGSFSMDIDRSSLSMGANTQSTSLLPMPLSSSVSALASSSHSDAGGVTFTEKTEKEILMRDKNLQELMKTDPKKVQRTIANRIGFAKRKANKEKQTRELERQVETMKTKCSTMSAQLLLLEKRCGELETQHKEMSMMEQEMEQQSKQKDAVRETLEAQIETLNHIKLNNAQQLNPQTMIDENSAWGAHGLHQQQMSRQITDGSASHMNNDLHRQMNQQMVELQQLQTQAQHRQAQGQ